MRDEALKKLPSSAIDMLHARILGDSEDLDMPPNVQEWAKRLEASCKEPGTFTIAVDFEGDQCSMSVQSSHDALEREPEALYINLTIETIGQLIDALRFCKKQLKKADRRSRAAEVADENHQALAHIAPSVAGDRGARKRR